VHWKVLNVMGCCYGLRVGCLRGLIFDSCSIHFTLQMSAIWWLQYRHFNIKPTMKATYIRDQIPYINATTWSNATHTSLLTSLAIYNSITAVRSCAIKLLRGVKWVCFLWLDCADAFWVSYDSINCLIMMILPLTRGGTYGQARWWEPPDLSFSGKWKPQG
jgi:hypothetical protein